MLSERKQRIQKQQEDDQSRKDEQHKNAQEQKRTEADLKYEQQKEKRSSRLAELEERFKIEDDKRFACLTLKGHEHWVTGLCFSGDRLVTCSADKTVKVWDVDKQKVKKTMTGHTSRINTVAADNRMIISGSQDGNVNVWDVRSGEISDTEPTEDGVAVTVLAMGDVSRHCMVGRADGEIRLLDLRSPITVVRNFFGHSGTITGMDFNADTLVSCSSDGTGRMWDFGTGSTIHTLKGHYSDVSCIKLCDDKIITGSYDEAIRYRDITSGKCRHKVMSPLGTVSGLTTELIAGSLELQRGAPW